MEDYKGTQHQHLMFSLETPQRNIRKITLWICWDPNCEDQGDLHAHQIAEPKTVNLRLRAESEERIRQWHNNEQKMEEIYDRIDDRCDKEHVSGEFWCADAECKVFFIKYAHLCNIDPAKPYWAIGKKVY